MTANKKATVSPYLTFPGNCREAMQFYQEALAGKIELMTFAGSPVEVPENYKEKILHASLNFGDALIMASDGMPGQEVNQGNASNISISAVTVAEAERFFKNLSNGAKVIIPFEDAFWGSKFGMLTDRFGIGWMVSCERE